MLIKQSYHKLLKHCLAKTVFSNYELCVTMKRGSNDRIKG